MRQLYRGLPHLPQFDKIISVYQEGRGATIGLYGHTWAVGADAAGSGFRYRLQNNDLGVIVFFQARHVKADQVGTHVKIELSPHYIQERDPDTCQRFMDLIASCLLDQMEYAGCAVHLALDVQGWQTPRDFMDRFVTRSN